MKIKKLHIDGFGIFNDYHIEGFTKGVNLLYGSNEKGKSTLLDFFRFTLFDYPTPKIDRRPPLNGGNHGGRIYLQSGNTKIEIYRSGDKKRFDILIDDFPADELSYNKLISNASKDLYESTYAINIDDLSNAAYLDNSTMSNKIFSLGTGINADLGQFEKALNAKAEDLFKSRGSKQHIITLRNDIGKLDNRIKELRANSRAFDEKTKEIEKIEDLILRTNQERRELDKRRGRLEAYLQAYESFVEYQRSVELLEAYSGFKHQPKQLFEEYKEVKSKLSVQEDNLSNIEEECLKLNNEAELILLNDNFQDKLHLLDELKSNVKLYEKNLNSLEDGKAHIYKTKEVIADNLRELSESFTVEQLMTLKIDKTLQEAADKKIKLCSDIERDITIAQSSYRDLEDKLLYEQQRIAEKQKLEGLSIRNQSELRAAYQRMAAYKAEKEGAIVVNSPTTSSQKNIILVAGVMLVVLAIVISISLALLWGVVIGLIAIGLLATQLMGNNSTTSLEGRSLTDIEVDIQHLQKEIEDYEKQVEEIRLLQEEYQRIELKIQQEKNRISKWTESVEEQEELWKVKLQQYTLPVDWKAEHIERYLGAIKLIQERQATLVVFQERLEELKTEISSFRKLLSSFGENTSVSVEAAELLIAQLEEQLKKKNEREAKYKQFEQKRNDIKLLQEELARLEKELEKKRLQIGVEEEMAFYNYFVQQEKYERLLEVKSNAESKIITICGVGSEFEQAMKIFKTESKIDIEQERNEVQTQLAETENLISEYSTRNGELKAQKEAILKDDELLALESKKNSLLEEYADAIKKWMSYRMAMEVLVESKSAYEKEKQPEVINYTKKYFNMITNGAYVDIKTSLGSKEMRVIDFNGKSKDISELSRGTKEQLLLTLRMGLIEEYEKKAEPLPLILDDVMVNFDNERAAYLAETLTNFAKDRQVLLFTCHEHTKLLFQNKSANIIEW